MRPRSGAEGGGGGAERAEGGGKASTRERPGGGGGGEGGVGKRSPSPSSGCCCCCCCCSSCEPVAAGAKALPSKPGRGPRVLFLLPEREFRRRKLIFFLREREREREQRKRSRAEEEVEREKTKSVFLSFEKKLFSFSFSFIHSLYLSIFFYRSHVTLSSLARMGTGIDQKGGSFEKKKQKPGQVQKIENRV